MLGYTEDMALSGGNPRGAGAGLSGRQLQHNWRCPLRPLVLQGDEDVRWPKKKT